MKGLVVLQLLLFLTTGTVGEGGKDKLTVSPYEIAGPVLGIIPQPSVPQTDVGVEIGQLPLPYINSWAFATFLAIAYSTFGPAFVWLSGTARTSFMRSWYSSFTFAFLIFGITLKMCMDVELPLWEGALLPMVLGATGMILGHWRTDPCFTMCSLWSSFLFVNLIHVLIGATEHLHYRGLGSSAWAVYPLALASFLLYLLVESKYIHSAQNLICSFTSAYAAIAALSFLLYYFLHSAGVEHSAFDVVSYIGLPIQFRWDSPVAIILLTLWIILTVAGFSFATYRDFRQGPSPGFFEGENGSLAGLMKFATTLSLKTERISSEHETRLPLLTFGGNIPIGGSRKSCEVALPDCPSFKGTKATTKGFEDLDFDDVIDEHGSTSRTAGHAGNAVDLTVKATDSAPISLQGPYYLSKEYAVGTMLPAEYPTYSTDYVVATA